MTTSLTIQGLIRHFQDRLRQTGQRGYTGGGSEPQFPQLVVYLGADAARVHPALSGGLLRLWPQYRAELKFLLARPEGEGLAFSQLPCGEEGEQPLTGEEVQELASSLFGPRMHFRDRSRLLVYYILDTSGFPGGEELTAWLARIRAVRALLCADSTDLMDILFLLLREDLPRQRTAARLRGVLSGFYGGNEVRQAVGGVLLLSNRRDDNAILEDWDTCCQIATASIALSNNPDPRVVSTFFDRRIMTASYAREEKPISQIGQVVVRALLDELANSLPQGGGKLPEDARLPERLGLSREGTFTLLDTYAQSHLFPLLPDEEQLELFPRRDTAFRGKLCSLSARDFNEYTMGAWQAYLRGIVDRAREELAADGQGRAAWLEEFRTQLRGEFSREELADLTGRLPQVEALLSPGRHSDGDAPVLAAARQELKAMLSGSPQASELFLTALREQGWAARDFADTWDGLLRSRQQVHTVRDNNISAFYERRVRNFFDRHGAQVSREFAGLHHVSELEPFLTGCLERIADSDGIFSCAFEEELESRLNEEPLPADANRYIRQKLTGEGVFTYLQTNFALGEPLLSAILLKAGTALHQSLRANLPPATYYYDTGSSTTAEALVFYQVSAENLVSGGEV